MPLFIYLLGMSKHVRDEKVLEPYLYLGQILGKNVRGVLIDCFQEWIAIPEEKMELIKVTNLTIDEKLVFGRFTAHFLANLCLILNYCRHSCRE